TKTLTMLTAATLALLLAVPVVAQEIDCADIEYDAEIVANYPEVQDACLDVVEDQGVRYVHLRAKVINNWISSLTIRYEHADGTWGLLKTVTPPEGFTAIVNGSPTPVEEIQEGTVMNIFVPEGRWELAMADVDMPAMTELTFAPVEVEEAEEPVAVEDEPTALEDEPAAAEAKGPYAGIPPALWAVLALAFVAILWLFIIKRRERQ
ncbi:MAG: hypothetical protein KAJ43_00830, partial [Gemmatimonadetes bacterium]|nr:hypothetical protein [Gemmatimonadota bacterium]